MRDVHTASAPAAHASFARPRRVSLARASLDDARHSSRLSPLPPSPPARRVLATQLKNLAKAGKLVKVAHSFKLSDALKEKKKRVSKPRAPRAKNPNAPKRVRASRDACLPFAVRAPLAGSLARVVTGLLIPLPRAKRAPTRPKAGACQSPVPGWPRFHWGLAMRVGWLGRPSLHHSGGSSRVRVGYLSPAPRAPTRPSGCVAGWPRFHWGLASSPSTFAP